MISNRMAAITITAVGSSRKAKRSANGIVSSFCQRVSHEKEDTMMPEASLSVHSGSLYRAREAPSDDLQ